MASALKSLSEYNANEIPSGKGLRISIVVSEYNADITFKLLNGCIETLTKHGVKDNHIFISYVPGAFELPLSTQFMLEHDEDLDGIIAIGCVIQGETKHFDIVCQGATQGLMKVMLEYNTQFSFCLLTDNTKQQSIDRSGGIHGNKGIECAVALLKMIAVQEKLD
jgi:6,7-dimethyl-8-ribityllumazine synthase